MLLEDYIKYKMLNRNSYVRWDDENKKVFFQSKSYLTLLCRYLRKNRLLEGENLTYKAGKNGKQRTAVIFAIYGDALHCYISLLHLGWNGHVHASSMLARRIYELLVDILFILQKDTDERLSRFFYASEVRLYERLYYLRPELSIGEKEEFYEEKFGIKYKNLKKIYQEYRIKFGKVGKGKNSFGLNYDFYGWTYGLLKEKVPTSILQRAEKVGLGGLHYKLGYSILSSKVHVDAREIGNRVKIADEFLNRINYSVLPDKVKYFTQELGCSNQYMRILFLVFASSLNLSESTGHEKFWKIAQQIKEHEDFRDCIKKMKKRLKF